MNSEQTESLMLILDRLEHIDSNPKWTKLDDYMSYLEWLDNEQMFKEADAVFEKHIQGNPRCTVDHDRGQCYAPIMVEAVEGILKLYDQTGYMHKTHRYVLQYYLAFTHAGEIFVD